MESAPRTLTKLVTSYSPPSERNDFPGQVGFCFTPTSPLTFNQMGVRCSTGNTGLHVVTLWDANNFGGGRPPTVVRQVNVDLTGGTLGNYYYVPFSPILHLIVGRQYFLTSTVTSGGQYWGQEGPTTLISGTSSVSDIYQGDYDHIWHINTANNQYVGIDLAFDGVDVVPLGLIDHTAGGPGNANGTTSEIDSTGANLLVVYLGGTGEFTGLRTITDSLANTWTLFQSTLAAEPGGAASFIYYVNSQTPIVGPGHSVTWNTGDFSFSIVCFSAWHSSSTWSLDNSVGSNGAMPLSAGSLTPANTSELSLTGATAADGVNLTAVVGVGGQAYTMLDNFPATSGYTRANAHAYTTGTVAGTSINPQWSANTSSRGVAINALFQGTWVAGPASQTLLASRFSDIGRKLGIPSFT